MPFQTTQKSHVCHNGGSIPSRIQSKAP